MPLNGTTATAVTALFEAASGLFGARMIALILHGSCVMDDLCPGYSDLDFLCVIDGDVSTDDCERLRQLRLPFRSGKHGPWGAALEGPFLRRRMLDPAQTGRAFCWGTSGERPWDRNQLGWFALRLVRERGLLYSGEDFRLKIPVPPRDELLVQVREFIASARQHAQGGRLKSIDWLLSAARLLRWVRDDTLCSKSAGAEWALIHAAGEWRQWLPFCQSLRHDPSLVDDPDVLAKLQAIRQPTLEACDELEKSL